MSSTTESQISVETLELVLELHFDAQLTDQQEALVFGLLSEIVEVPHLAEKILEIITDMESQGDLT